MREMVPFGRDGIMRRTGFEDFNNMLDSFFAGSKFPNFPTMNTFRLDVQENDEEYCVEAELPGIRKEQIDVSLEEGRLIISVRREESVEQTEKNYVHRERSFSSMQRAVYLDDADPDDVKAKLDSGILRLNIKKQKQTQRRSSIVIE